MDDLEKFVNKNRDLFDEGMPRKKVWNNIDSTVNPIIPLRKNNWILKTTKIAASIIILTLAAFGVFYLVGENNANGNGSQNMLAQEIVELDSYYEQKVKVSLVKVNEQLTDTAILNDITRDLEILTQEKKEILEELKNGYDDKRLIESLMKTYKLKLNILEEILTLLNNNENEYNI